MRKFLKEFVRRLFAIPRGCAVPFGVKWRLGQLIGFNRHVPWPVHFTSTVHAPSRVKLGKATFPGDSPGCYINAQNGIEVGDFTNLGPSVGLISANHDPLKNDQWLAAPPIKLGKHCWLGMHAVVLPGVTLGDNTIVGAGAIVTKSFPHGYVVLAGNPARVVREVKPR